MNKKSPEHYTNTIAMPIANRWHLLYTYPPRIAISIRMLRTNGDDLNP
jgi:hypothetical protein